MDSEQTYGRIQRYHNPTHSHLEDAANAKKFDDVVVDLHELTVLDARSSFAHREFNLQSAGDT